MIDDDRVVADVARGLHNRADVARELHKQARRNFPRRHVELKGIHDLYQADLVEMIPYSNLNEGFKYIMTVINCFSKFAIALPLKTKTGKEIEINLKQVLLKYPMKHLHTDEGKEWFNTKVKNLLKTFKVNHYATFSEKKASIVERFNRTLKNHMWRVFSEQGNYRWLELLPKLVDVYNNTVHRTIGLKPIEVNLKNEKDVLLKIVKGRKKHIKLKTKFKIGDRVRISRLLNVFTKGYLPRWSNEIYTVWKVQPTYPVTYILKDDNKKVLKGGFYQQELSHSKTGEVYLIEKVIKRKGNKLLVRWLGFDKSYDSWIDAQDLL